jgi:hypothetical protein
MCGRKNSLCPDVWKKEKFVLWCVEERTVCALMCGRKNSLCPDVWKKEQFVPWCVEETHHECHTLGGLPVTAEIGVWSQGSPSGVYGGLSDTGTDFFGPQTSVSSCQWSFHSYSVFICLPPGEWEARDQRTVSQRHACGSQVGPQLCKDEDNVYCAKCFARFHWILPLPWLALCGRWNFLWDTGVVHRMTGYRGSSSNNRIQG